MNNSKKNTSMTVMTILFIAAILSINYFIFKSGSYKYDILSKNIIFQINEDGTVNLEMDISVNAKDKKTYEYLLNGYKKSDIEKSKGYEKIFNERKEAYCKVENYKSKVSTSNLNITVKESMVLKGIIELKEDTLIFLFPIKRLNLDANSNLYVYFPDSWTLKEAEPNPSKNMSSYALWSNLGTVDFSKIILTK